MVTVCKCHIIVYYLTLALRLLQVSVGAGLVQYCSLSTLVCRLTDLTCVNDTWRRMSSSRSRSKSPGIAAPAVVEFITSFGDDSDAETPVVQGPSLPPSTSSPALHKKTSSASRSVLLCLYMHAAVFATGHWLHRWFPEEYCPKCQWASASPH